MIAKLHNINGKKIVAICDKNIFGKKYTSGKIQLDLSSSFYKGTEVHEKGLIGMIRGVYTLNAVGGKSVNFLTKLGIVSDKNIGKIKKIPYAFVVIE